MIQRSFFFLLLFLFTAGLTAQSPELFTTADEVVVTGSKLARSQRESPRAVTVIDSATIARSADLAQLLNEQAGLVVNGAYANFSKDRSLFQRNGPNAFTLILLDGQPLLDPSAIDGALDLRLLSLDGLRRIEVLRGPQALLYGADAVAGVINLITEVPDGEVAEGASKPSVTIRASAMTHNTYEGSAHLSGRSKVVDYRVGYEYFTSEGVSEATPPDSVRTEFEPDGVDRQTISAGLTVRPLAGLSIRPSLRMTTFDGGFDGGAFQDAENRYEGETLFGAIAADYRLEKATLGASFSRTTTDRAFFNNAFGFTSNFEGRASQGDVYAVVELGKTSQLTAGVQLRSEAINDVALDTLRDATTTAPYLQFSTRLAEKFLIDAGLRYNNHSQFGGNLNYSLAAAVELTESLTARLAATSAFQSPTLDQLYGPFGPNPDLEPQTANSVELGFGYADPAAKYNFQLSAFARSVENIIVFTDRYNNRDELNDVGLELTGRGQLTKQLSASGYVSYVKGTLQTEDFSGTAREQTEFFRRPRTTGRLTLTYNADFPLTVRLAADYTGERPDIFFNPDFSSQLVELNPYWLVGLYSEYRIGKRENLRLFVDLRNLTDADFTEVAGFSTLGRTVRVGVSATF